jgi:hypothetical protein
MGILRFEMEGKTLVVGIIYKWVGIWSRFNLMLVFMIYVTEDIPMKIFARITFQPSTA